MCSVALCAEVGDEGEREREEEEEEAGSRSPAHPLALSRPLVSRRVLCRTVDAHTRLACTHACHARSLRPPPSSPSAHLSSCPRPRSTTVPRAHRGPRRQRQLLEDVLHRGEPSPDALKPTRPRDRFALPPLAHRLFRSFALLPSPAPHYKTACDHLARTLECPHAPVLTTSTPLLLRFALGKSATGATRPPPTGHLLGPAYMGLSFLASGATPLSGCPYEANVETTRGSVSCFSSPSTNAVRLPVTCNLHRTHTLGITTLLTDRLPRRATEQGTSSGFCC